MELCKPRRRYLLFVNDRGVEEKSIYFNRFKRKRRGEGEKQARY